MTDDELLQRFVDTFAVLDELWIGEGSERDGDLTPVLVRPWDSGGASEWQPVRDSLPVRALNELYVRVAGPLPPLYERLILSYRWAKADVEHLRLLPNLPPGLWSLAAAMTRDGGLFEMLAPAGFVQFGQGPDYDYDPVCFDLRRRGADGDCRVVKFDHEEILCNRRLVEVQELAPSFRHVVELVIETANLKLNESK